VGHFWGLFWEAKVGYLEGWSNGLVVGYCGFLEVNAF
jgi:hypothetical protein